MLVLSSSSSACRSVIKYNSTLDAEQKNEILTDLDFTLQFLRERLIANTAIESNSVIPPLQLAELLAASAEDHEDYEFDARKLPLNKTV